MAMAKNLVREWLKENRGKALVFEESSSADIPIEKCLDGIKEYFDCAICRDPLEQPIQTQCGHVFCSKCLGSLSKKSNSTCPLCKKPISNRALISRDDVGELLQLFDKLNNAFNMELQKFLHVKAEKQDGTGQRKAILKERVVKQIKQKLATEDKEENAVALPKRVNLSRRKSNAADDESVVILDDTDEVQNQNPVTSSSMNKALHFNKNEEKALKAVVPYSGGAPKEPKPNRIPKSQLYEQMMNQNYKIMAVDVIPEVPLDLSMARSSDLDIKYKCNESPIRFVKPLDLSMKKEKRKFDDVDEACASPKIIIASASRPKPDTPHPRYKKGKFDNQEKLENSGPAQSSGKPEHPTKKTKLPNKKKAAEDVVDFDSPMPVDQQIFTPSPPPPSSEASVFPPTPPAQIANQNHSTRKTNVNMEKNIGKRPILRHQHHNAGISQNNYLESEILRDFDLPFEELEQETGYDGSDDDSSSKNEEFAPTSGSGGKITSSDEIFCNITEQFLVPKQKEKSQQPTASSGSRIGKSGDSFVFKQPIASISQAAKKRSRDDKNKREDSLQIEDDFLKPRDSDYLLFDVSMSGNGGSSNTNGKEVARYNSMTDSDFAFSVLPSPNSSNSSSDGKEVDRRRKNVIMTDSDAIFSNLPDNISSSSSSSSRSNLEKENGPRTRFLSRNVKRKASPAKSSGSSLSRHNVKENTKNKPTKQGLDQDLTSDFNDDNEFAGSDDFMMEVDVDVPEAETGGAPKPSPSGKGKQKQMSEQTRSVAPTTKKSYVFCPTRLNKAQTIKLNQLCLMCDGTTTKDFTDDVTHLIIDVARANGKVPQTLKYLLAIASRKWVVFYEWVDECVRAGRMVDEEPFEAANFNHCDPGVRRARLAEKNLFEGFKFYFATEIYKALGFTKGEVMLLLKALGATVVDAAESRYRDLIIIGSKNGNSTDYNDWMLTNKWVTVTFDWVIECILDYRLRQFEPKHLCVETFKVKSINAPKAFQVAFTKYLTQRSPQ